jgi:hypothetical protein
MEIITKETKDSKAKWEWNIELTSKQLKEACTGDKITRRDDRGAGYFGAVLYGAVAGI